MKERSVNYEKGLGPVEVLISTNFFVYLLSFHIESIVCAIYLSKCSWLGVVFDSLDCFCHLQIVLRISQGLFCHYVSEQEQVHYGQPPRDGTAPKCGVFGQICLRTYSGPED